jgi:hypothetical protein
MQMKWDDNKLIKVMAEAIKWLMGTGVQVLVDSTLIEELANFNSVNLESPMIRLFQLRPVPNFGSSNQLFDSVTCGGIVDGRDADADGWGGGQLLADLSNADLVFGCRRLHGLHDPILKGGRSSCGQACWQA